MTRKTFWFVLKNSLALLLMCCTVPVYAASFDCERAATPTEHAICDSKALGEQDSRLGDRYSEAMASSSVEQRKTLRSAQLAWMKSRNACSEKTHDAEMRDRCLATHMKERTQKLEQITREAQGKLDKIIASIPDNPVEAAEALRTYPGPLASAWLVYLHQFEPQSGVTDKEAEQRYQVAAKEISQDRFPYSLLRDIEADRSRSKDEAVLTLLRMIIERESYHRYSPAGSREYVHCFIFSRQGEKAYSTFGALYGSTRDSFAPICPPQGDLFEQPAWKQLDTAFKPAIGAAYEGSGTIRNLYFANWRMFALRATVSPHDFLKSPENSQTLEKPRAAISAWENAEWPKAERENALTAIDPAISETAQWLQKEKAFSADDSEKTARTMVATWISLRFDFIDDNLIDESTP